MNRTEYQEKCGCVVSAVLVKLDAYRVMPIEQMALKKDLWRILDGVVRGKEETFEAFDVVGAYRNELEVMGIGERKIEAILDTLEAELKRAFYEDGNNYNN
jgi:hypothetical protein